MKRTGCLFLSGLLCLGLLPASAFAGAAVSEMYGVREVILDFTHFDDPRASDTCGLSRALIADVIANSLKGTSVPAIPANEARPPVTGIFRINLVPQISTYVDETLGCVSWISLSAENRISVAVPPVNVQRAVTAVYWRHHLKVVSTHSTHTPKVSNAVKTLAEKFAQQFRADQPPELPE